MGIGLVNRVPLRAQNADGEATHHVIVLDDQQRLRARRGNGDGGRLRANRFLVQARKNRP